MDQIIHENSSLKSTLSDLKHECDQKFIMIESKIGDISPENALKFESIYRDFDDLNDETNIFGKKLSKEIKNDDADAQTMLKVYEEGQGQVNQIMEKLKKFEAKAESYIAISQYRESMKKENDLMKGFYEMVSDVSSDERSDDIGVGKNNFTSAKHIETIHDDTKQPASSLLPGDKNNDLDLKSEHAGSIRKMSLQPKIEKSDIKESKNESEAPPKQTYEEHKREQMRKQVSTNQESLDKLQKQLERLKAKQVEQNESESRKKPKITHEMVMQIKTSHNICRDLKQKFENFDNDIPARINEISAKVGNKTDIVEFEDEIKRLEEMIESVGKNAPVKIDTSTRRKSKFKYDKDANRPDIGIVQQPAPVDTTLRKLVDRNMAEVNNRLNKFEDLADQLKNEYSKHSSEIRTLSENISIMAKQDQIQMLSKQIIILNDRIDGIKDAPKLSEPIKPAVINSNTSSRSDKKGSKESSNNSGPKTQQISKIIINNNADKLETEKCFREVNREVKKLRTDTFQQFDHTDDSITQFKTSVNKILERQDQSILSILTRTTSLEIRTDSLELDGVKGGSKIDTGIKPGKTRQNRADMLEALQIVQKLVGDFRAMREEVYKKVYEIQENGLNKKADLDHIHEIDARMQEGFNKLEISHKKYRTDMTQNLKNLTERIKKQTYLQRAASPNPDIDASAMLSKRYDKGSKCANCDKDLGQLDHVRFDFSKRNIMPNRMKKDNKMVHMGKGYSKLLQSLNLSPEDSFKNDDLDDSYAQNESTFRTIDRELDPANLEINTKKLPQIRSVSNLANFEFK